MKSQKGGFRIAKTEKTREQIEYDEATKNVKVLTARLRLSQQGIDTSSISRQELDRIIALYDKMDVIAADTRNKTSEIQRDSNTDIQRVNQKANEKYSQASKEIDILINKMKKAEKVTDEKTEPETGIETIKEEIKPNISPEKMKEDIINSFTDRIMQKVRKEVTNTFEEYMNMISSSPMVVPQVTIGQGVVNKDVAEEIVINAGQVMVEESKKIKPERPDDKDIPVITSEMMKNTDEEIAKKRTEEI